MTKAEIRSDMVHRREQISANNKLLWDRQIFQRAHKDRSFQVAQRVHIFRSTDQEIDTWPFIEYAWSIGKTVFVPRVVGRGSMVNVMITRATTWHLSRLNIMEPDPDPGEITAEAADFGSDDAIIVPLLAFDVNGGRLGYGMDFYDAFLNSNAAARIGIAYEFQRLPLVPTEPHDAALDRIATPERWYQKR